MRSLLFILLFLSFDVNAQVIDTNNIDLEKLNEELFKQVNLIRTRKRLDSLSPDQVLTDAADDHAQYMTDKDELGHGQKTRGKRTPDDRVRFYGGTHNAVAENVLFIEFGYELRKGKYRLTYERFAKLMADRWKKSKGHYNNIINPMYDNAGLAMKLTDGGQLYVCMVYGSKPFDEKYNYAKGQELFVKNKEECFACNQTRKQLDKDKAHLGWYSVSNDSIYYWNVKKFKKKNNVRRIFGKHGVVAVDLIHQEQFDCEGKPSYHNSLYHDGYYLGYVDKKKLKEENLSPYPGYYKVFVSTKPAFLDTFYQVDFNYLKKDRPCLKNSLIFVSPDFLKPSEYFSLPQPKVELGNNLVVYDSLTIRIPFERNQTNQDTSIFKSLKTALDSLASSNYVIKTIRYTGVASIEGSRAQNENLFLKRGEIVESYLTRYYPQYKFEKDFFENFDDFRAGLSTLGYTDLIGFPEDSLRYFANQNVGNPEIDDLLDETRYSTVRITFAEYIPIQEGSYGLSVERINDLIETESTGELLPLYLYMANDALENDSSLVNELLKINFPEKKEFGALHWAQFVLDLKANESEVTGERLNELRNLEAIPSDDTFVEYALLFNVYYGYSAIELPDVVATIDQIMSKRRKSWLLCLHYISQVQTFRMSPSVAVPTLYDLVSKKKLNSKQSYFVCQFMIEWGYTVQPYLLLSKHARRRGEIPKLYKQYLKLGFYLKQFDNPRSWKKIRMVVQNFAEDSPEEFCSLFRWNEMGVKSLEKPEMAGLFCEKCRE
ncbi:MAG: CAP domain-containing protein [Crocinitomicaceae bacterium]|nr:CAP domain-containing protein [Crocinitomicaceae bacterium]